MFSWVHWDVIDEHFSAYRDICEGGWDIKVVILTAASWTQQTVLWARRNLYCYRREESLSLEVRKFNESLGRRIADYSRIPTAEYLELFDVFIFLEDDMIMTYSLLTAWVRETNILGRLTYGKTLMDKPRCGWKAPCKYSIGLLRYSRKRKYLKEDLRKFGIGKETLRDTEEHFSGNDVRTNQNVWEDSVVWDKNRLEEVPQLDPICIEGQPYIAIYTNSHQGGWVMTQEDVKELNKSCNFLSQYYHPHWKNSGMVREYMNSLSVYRNTWFVTRPLNCMVLKVIPAKKLEVFKFRHYYRSKDSKKATPSVHEVDELTRNGLDYTLLSREVNMIRRNNGTSVLDLGQARANANMKAARDLPLCWQAIVKDD